MVKYKLRPIEKRVEAYKQKISQQPTIGTAKYGVGTNPYRLVSSSMLAIALGGGTHTKATSCRSKDNCFVVLT